MIIDKKLQANENSVSPVLENKMPLTKPESKKTPLSDNNLEDFIGGNLISKIGIGVLIIGLGIFVKFAIDNNLISPVTRIILAYLAGGTLLWLAYRFKSKYMAYSAVLLSGGVATLYFTTFIAFDFYQLFPRFAAFTLMLLISSYTIFAAIRQYRQEVIGIIGLVGAYAVPMLLSTNIGSIPMLGYVVLIDSVILIISFRLNWHTTSIVAFVLSWMIYIIGDISNSYGEKNLFVAFGFGFFVIFYSLILANTILKKISFDARIGIFLTVNSFLFYVTGVELLYDYSSSFTLLNAVFHGLVAFGLFRFHNEDKKLFYTVVGMALFYLTAAIRIKFNGAMLPVLWASETAILFSIGRIQKIRFYEIASYILLFLTIVGIYPYWSMEYYAKDIFTFIFNPAFGTSALVLACIGVVNWVHFKYPSNLPPHNKEILDHSLFGLLLVLGYISLFLEINHILFDQYRWQIIWLVNYSLIYTIFLMMLALRFIHHDSLNKFSLTVAAITTLGFIFTCMPVLKELRDLAFTQKLPDFWQIRYLCYALLGGLAFSTKLMTDKYFPDLQNVAHIFIQLVVILLLSNELTNLLVWNSSSLQIQDAKNTSYKLGYSILWGLYSFGLIAYGLWQKKRLWRFMGISLFGITLIKIVFADIQYSTTISKIIVFISLGVLMLIVSFLYQKYKHIILQGDEESDNNLTNP
jgi:uncharacterized membrane protein